MTAPAAAPPYVSVVVPTWNRAPYLRALLETLVAQDHPADRYEIVVSDDGSIDDTARVVAGFAGDEHPPVRYVGRDHVGYCAAVNAGVAAAAGDILSFLDSDELVPATHVSRVVDRMSDPSIDGVGGPARDYGGGARTCPHCSLAAADVSDRGNGFVLCLLGGNMAIRRSVLEEVGPFDEELSGRGDEMEWFHRAKGHRFLYDPGLWVWHRRDGMSLVTLSRAAFRDGMTLPVQHRKIGMPYRARPGRIARCMGHAVLRRCTRGWVLALQQAGADAGYLRDRIRLSGRSPRGESS